jgi:glycosyltransferase involved in cell wall biosynthesis
VDALASALIRLLSNREETDTVGRAGRADAMERFSMDVFTDRILACYQ